MARILLIPLEIEGHIGLVMTDFDTPFCTVEWMCVYIKSDVA